MNDPSTSLATSTRRHWIQGTAAAAAGVALFAKSSLAETQTTPQRVLRLAHLTDIHVQPELNAERGMADCLHQVQSMDDPPTVILTGGDSVMDVMNHDLSRAKVQADIWQRTIKNECSLPVRSCIGNHDVWGWNKSSSSTTGDEKLWGKAFGEDLLGLKNRYYHYDEAGWRLVVLDSTYPSGNGYTAKLDEEQFDWLARLLRDTPSEMPVLVLSHIPIVSVAAYFDGANEKSGDWQVPGSYMHIDARRIKDLFLKHPTVKLCLSGHLHLADEVMYNGVTYCCNGAVCGGWWKGNYHECEPGFGIVDLFDDGSVHNKYVNSGWKAV